MKILVVDDNASNRKFLRLLLTQDCHTVLEGSDGIEALDIRRGPAGRCLALFARKRRAEVRYPRLSRHPSNSEEWRCHRCHQGSV